MKTNILKLRTSIFASSFISIILLTLFSSGCWKIEPQKIPFTKVKTVFNANEKFGEPFGIAVRNSEIFASDGETGKIWRISNFDTFSVATDKLDTPSAIAFDTNGDLIVADSGTHTIKKVIIATSEVETIAGTENQSGFVDGDSKNALFNSPIGIAISKDKIFVADTYNDKIRVVENGKVSTLSGSEKGFIDSENGLTAKFDTPCGIALTKDGKLVVADTGNKRLRIVEENGETWTLAGNGSENSVNGFLFDAGFVQPLAVAIDDSGVIYVADGNSIRVIGRRLFPIVETLSDTKRGFSDGNLRTSRFNRPSGLTIDEAGNLFVADAENQVVRVLTGGNVGKEITEKERANLSGTPEEFSKLGEPRWTFNPPEKARDIAGTLGEIRGEINEKNKSVWFHNGLDIAGNYGETARFIRTEKVLRPVAVENFATSRELIRMPEIGYIHIRFGRDQNNTLFGDKRFQFSFDENKKLNGLRIPRGTKFNAGEAIGTLNSMNHVHLIAGRSAAEMNALDAIVFPNISDSLAPTIERVSLFDENWLPIETEKTNQRIKLLGKTRIVVRAFDQMNGNAGYRKLGVYRIGYQILKADKTPQIDIKWTISFDRLPDEDAVKFVYARGSQSGYMPQTVFNYIASNEVHSDVFRENFFDAHQFEQGNYVLRVLVADFFGNLTMQDIEINVAH
ncbi:MAG: hypothetical protein LC778_08575 [Acidobacteria bacterium]|nr:hypothetical protein [Acidobacteriota bacterium]